MKPLRNAGAILWQVLFAFNFAVMLVLCYPWLWLFFKREAWWKYALVVQRFWAKWLLVTMGIRCKIEYEQPLNPHQPYIFTPNHTNFLDIIIGYSVVPGYFHFMAKDALAKIPLFKILFQYTHIPFNRASITQANGAYVRAAQDLAKGYSIVVFPEGTQNSKAGTLLPFKNGAFKLSVETQIPIVPITYLNHLSLLSHQENLFTWGSTGKPGVARIKVGAPVYPHEANNDAAELNKKIRTIVLQNLTAYAN